MGNMQTENLGNLKSEISFGRHTSSGCEDNSLMDLKETGCEFMN
jgi:hypothetical protein